MAGHVRYGIWCRDVILSHIDLRVAIGVPSLFAIILLTISTSICIIKNTLCFSTYNLNCSFYSHFRSNSSFTTEDKNNMP